MAHYYHKAAVKALDWIEPGLLASGGGTVDSTLKLWRDGDGVFQTIDTGSQICSITHSVSSSEIVTCQGFSLNQIIVWSREGQRISTIHGHTSRVLYCARSPNGEFVATGAGDQTLKVWRMFKRVQREDRLSHIDIR